MAKACLICEAFSVSHMRGARDDAQEDDLPKGVK